MDVMVEVQKPHNLPSEPEPTAVQERTLFADIAAIVGFIILIVIVIWGLVHLVSLGGNWISSLSGGAPAPITVTAPNSAESGTPFTISWKYTPSVNGSYAFLYPCHDGLTFMTAASQSAVNATYSIPCGAAYTMPVTNNSLSVTPTLSASSSVVTSLSIVFLPNATGTAVTLGQAQGATTITITPAQATAPTVTAKSTTAKRRVVNAGPADLSVSGLTGSVDSSGNAAASFTIANVGGSSTGTYYFTASLPTQSGAYTSPIQYSLAPGDRIVNTLNFGPVQGGGVITVTVIPGGADANATNNSASFTLSGSYYGGNYNYNNTYPTPAYTTYGGGVYYPNTYPYTPQSYPYQNQPLYYTSNSQPTYNYPYNQYQQYNYNGTYPY